jgi:hypothetical protein
MTRWVRFTRHDGSRAYVDPLTGEIQPSVLDILGLRTPPLGGGHDGPPQAAEGRPLAVPHPHLFVNPG